MVFNLFKRFSPVGNSEVLSDPTRNNSEVLPDPSIYKGKKLYMGNQYKGIIIGVGVKKGTKEIVRFKVSNNGTEEIIEFNDKRYPAPILIIYEVNNDEKGRIEIMDLKGKRYPAPILIIKDASEGIPGSNDGGVIQGNKGNDKVIAVGGKSDEKESIKKMDEEIQALIKEMDERIQVIKNSEESIHKAVEWMMMKKDLNNDEREYIREYMDHAKREKGEAVNRCRELLKIFINKIDKVKAALDLNRSKANELEMRKEINGRLDPDDEDKLARIRAIINEEMELLSKLYIKQKEYEKWCSSNGSTVG